MNKLKFSLKLSTDNINVIIGSVILPSLLLPVRFSSLILIITSIASINNLISKRNEVKLLKYLYFPFVLYFLSVLISFFIDLLNNQFEVEFILRNLSILIIPLFIFTSNFSKIQLFRLFKKTSLLITLIGVFFIFLWVFGYLKFNGQQEFQKTDWFKNEIITPKEYLSQNSKFKIIIKPSAIKPSLRKVIMLSNNQTKTSIIREFSIKTKSNDKNVWALLRNVNDGNCKAWFNIVNGKIGNIEGGAKVHSEKLSNDFFKFTLRNKIKLTSSREWFYISFVSGNGSYKWNNNSNKSVLLELKSPKLYLESGESLLKKENIFKYRITDFSTLEKYAHSTYFGLVFIFALIFFVFNSTLNNYLRFSVIIFLVFIIIMLASKAILVSLFLLLPVYYFYNYFNLKHLTVVLLFGFLISLNGHVKERFNDMFNTIIKTNNDTDLGDLENLSTNNRIVIYKNYLNLIKNNSIIGYGYKQGEIIIKDKYNIRFNTHNQYLQSWFNSGIMGLFLLILFSIFPFMVTHKRNKEKFGFELLIILILFNFLFESLLFRQWGLIFVSFSYAIYLQFFKLNLKWFQ